MAEEDLTEIVTIRYEPTQETREVPRGAVSGFVNEHTPGWVLLDSSGRKRAHQPTPAATSSKEL